MLFIYRHKTADCPYELALGLVSKRWKPRILTCLADQSMRFKDLKSVLSPLSDKVLTQALDDLTADGLISRTAFDEFPPRVEYFLTDPGRELLDALSPLAEWTRRHHE